MERKIKEGYVIEINDTFNNKIVYFESIGYIGGPYTTYHVTEDPYNAEVFKTKKEALNTKNEMYRKYPKKDCGYQYKIRFIKITTYYELH